MRSYRARKREPDPRDDRIAELEAEVTRLTAALETWRYLLVDTPRVMAEAIETRETHVEEVVPHGSAEGFIHFGRPSAAPKPVPRGGRSRRP